MPAIRVGGSCTASPVASGGLGGHLGGRVRSASPSRRALAIDMRRIASLLRDPPVGTGAPGDASVNTSICSSPHSAWEPGDRGAAPMGANNVHQRVAMHGQFSMLTDKVNVIIAGLRSQCDSDRRRIAQLERKVESQLDERSGNVDGREKWAETMGKVNGLEEETQAVSRRIDKSIEQLDKRIWDRTSGSEAKCRSLEQQLQALEQQSRHASTTTEEVQKRQAAKLRRTEHAVEELSRRLAKAEEERMLSTGPQQGYVEQRFSVVEQNQEQLSMDMQQLQDQIAEELQAIGDNQGAHNDDNGESDHDIRSLEEAVQVAERSIAALDKKLSPQIEDFAAALASMRVKADGQFHRVASLTERLETSHEPAMESMRAEIAQARAQDQRELSGELAAMRSRVHEVAEAGEESNAELRESLRQVRAEIAAVSLRPEDNPMFTGIQDRFGTHEREILDLRARVDSMPQADEQFAQMEGGDQQPDEWEVQGAALDVMPAIDDARRRLEWLEEQASSGAGTEKPDNRQLAQVQNTLCDIVEQVSNLKQRTSSSENASSAVQQQLQHLQSQVEHRSTLDVGPGRAVSEVDAKVSAVSQQVADLAARLLEVEGDREFARENESIAGIEVSAISMAAEVASNVPGRGLPPLPRGEVERERGAGDASAKSLGLEKQLEAVAIHLEAMDELVERVNELEQRCNTGGEGAAAEDQISFGPSSTVAAPSSDVLAKEVDNIAQEVAEVRSRLMVAERTLEKQPEAPANAAELASQAAELRAVEERVRKLEASSSSDRPSNAAASDLGPIEARVVKLEAGQDTSDVHELYDKLNERVDQLQADIDQDRSQVDLLAEKVSVDQLAEKVRKCEVRLQPACDWVENRKDGLETDIEALKRDQKESAVLSESIQQSTTKLEGRISSLENLKSSEEQRGGGNSSAPDEALVDIKASVQSLTEKLSSVSEKADKAATEAEASSEAVVERLDAFEGNQSTVRSSLDALQKDVTSFTACSNVSMTQLKQDLKERLQRIEDTSEGKLTIQEHRSQYDKLSASQDELRVQLSDVAVKATEAAAGVQQLREEGLNAPATASPSASSTAPTAADEKARAQVQTQVEELRQQVLDEVRGLSGHQAELAEAREALKNLADKVANGDKNGGDSQVLQQDAEARQRLKVIEEAVETLRKDLKPLQDKAKGVEISEVRSQLAELQAKFQEQSQSVTPGVRKIGISMSTPAEEPASSPIAVVRKKLDDLSETVADLQCKVSQGTGSATGSAPAPRSGEQSKENSFNFSITEAFDQTADKLGGSLNLSVTCDQAGTGGGGGGSSPGSSEGSDSSPKDSRRTAELPSVGINARGSKGRKEDDDGGEDDELEALMKDIGAGIGAGSKKKPSDALDSLVSKTADSTGSRPRPSALDLEDQSGTAGHLPSVAEEESADLSEEAAKSKSGGGSGSAGIVGRSVTPKSTKSTKSNRSAGDSPTGGGLCEVSMSVNEVSIGCDISVEDSLQLEDECDHVENVKPNPKAPDTTVPASATAAMGETVSTSASASASPKAAALASQKSPPSVAAKSSVGLAGAAADTSAAARKTSPKSASQSKDDGDEKYDDSFDEDDMSVPESIEESPDNSGSGGWGTGEAV